MDLPPAHAAARDGPLIRRGAFAAFLLLCAAAALGDGGRLRARQDAGPFAITIFTAPEPLASGPADISVLVQDRQTSAVVLDASVELELAGPSGGAPRTVQAEPGSNRLMRSAAVALDRPGPWTLTVVVRRAEESARVACALPVAPATSPLATAWPFLAFPPAAVALFALRGAIRRERD